MNSNEIEDLTACAAFLAMAEKENLMLNGRTATEALEAYARLSGLPVDAIRKLAK